MTEEIIIDGVNVAGCDFFAKEDLYNSYSGETQAYKGECGCSDDEMCKDIKNCCYKKQGKQLKRLEQENKELKKENENYKLYGSSTIVAPVNYTNTEYDLLANKVKGLELENIKLKNRNQQMVGCITQNEIYKQAFEEIKKDFMCFRTCMLPFHVGNKENLPHNMADAIQNYCESIKNKIDEVLNHQEG